MPLFCAIYRAKIIHDLVNMFRGNYRVYEQMFDIAVLT